MLEYVLLAFLKKNNNLLNVFLSKKNHLNVLFMTQIYKKIEVILTCAFKVHVKDTINSKYNLQNINFQSLQ